MRGKDGVALNDVIAEVRGRMAKVGNSPSYLTFDIDALDQAFASSTAKQAVGGLSTSQAMTLLESWHDLNWVSMDCIEVSPPCDREKLTSNAAATLACTWLCGCVAAAKKSEQ